MNAVAYLMPLLVALLLADGLVHRVPVFEAFLEGAKENMKLSVQLLPTLLAMLLVISMLNASGAIGLVQDLLSPLLTWLGFPKECVPLALLRPLSGSGSLAVFSTILQENGADSIPGLVASVLQGASETTFYTIALYFGATGVKNGRHTLFCALLGDFSVFVCSTLAVRLLLS